MVVLAKAASAGFSQRFTKHMMPTLRRQLSTKQAVFNDDVKQLHREQAALTARETDFEFEYLRDAVAESLVDRVNDIMLDFEHVVDLGCNTGNVMNALATAAKFEGRVPGGIKKLTLVDSCEEMLTVAEERMKRLTTDLEDVDFTFANAPFDDFCPRIVEPESVDLVLSSMSMHWANDLHSTLENVMQCLKPNGAFIGAMLGDDTLFELRTSLAIAQQERQGGLSPHVSPMLPSADACALLNKAGFKLQTVDNAEMLISFENVFGLMEHLSFMGEANANVASLSANKSLLNRDTLLAAAATYQHLFQEGDGSVPAQFQVIYMIGWKPDASHPKPLERGSGTVSLGDLGSLGQGANIVHHVVDE